MKYFFRFIVAALFLPAALIMIVLMLLSLALTVVQLPIVYIMCGNIREDDLIAFWFFEHGFDPFIWAEGKLKERNLL